MTEFRSFELSFLGGPPDSTVDEEAAGSGDSTDLPVVDTHEQEIRDLAEMLEHHFDDERQVHVVTDVAIYHEEGDPGATIVPDVMVLRLGPGLLPPGHFKLWESGPSPAAVIEVSARETREEDLGVKRDVCEHFGVAEYFLYDPLGDYLDPPFRGYRLVGRNYEILAPEADGSVVSGLGLSFRVDDGRLVVVDTVSGKPLMHTAEALDELERLRSEFARLLR